MDERRKHIRIEAPLEIWLSLDGAAKETTTMNFSDGGALVRNCFSTVPPVGAEISLQLVAPVLGKPAPILRGLVVRATAGEIACRFVDGTQPGENTA